MIKKHLLIINCDKKDAVDAIENFEDADISVLTDSSFERYLSSDTKKYVVDDVRDLFACQQVVAKIDQINPIDNIIGVDEKALWLAAYLRSYFNIGDLDYEQSKLFMNKLSTKDKWLSDGLNCTPCSKISNIEQIPEVGDRIGWPVVLKRAYGAGTQFTFVLNSKADFFNRKEQGEFKDLVERSVPMMLERFINIRTEYHIDSVIYEGEVVFLSIAAYTAPCIQALGEVHGSYTINSSHPQYEKLAQINLSAIESLGLKNGVAHLEVFDTQDGLVLSEIANRPGGGAIPQAIAVQFNYDYWTAFFEASVGIKPRQETNPIEGIVVRIQLPAKLGRIKRITTREEFLQLDCVADALVAFRDGDEFQDRMTSVFLTGIVFATADSYDKIDQVIETVISHYVLDVEEKAA